MQPPLGLLLDVDGPISNPDRKAIVDPHIVPSILALLGRGVPVVFNTGRSVRFVLDNVFGPIVDSAQGIENVRLDSLHAVCEKGAVWLSASDPENIHCDKALEVPHELITGIRRLVEDEFADTTFFDDTKLTMVSTERRLDVDADTYADAQQRFVAASMALLGSLGLGVVGPETRLPDRLGETPYCVDPTIIATDIENSKVGKDLGALRALELMKPVAPRAWRTVGDSGTDYAMADWLHTHGHEVKHIDVRENPRVDLRPYEVLVPRHTSLDAAGSRYLRSVLQFLDGDIDAETNFDAEPPS